MEIRDLLFDNRILYLSRNDLVTVGLLDYAAIVEDVRRGLRMHARGEAISNKLALDFDVERDWKVTSLVGVVGPYAGVKWLGANEDNRALGLPRSSSIIALNDRKTGKVLCVMDGTLISALRTGAYAALATEVLGPPQATCVGFLGAGVISRCSLLCMAATVRERIERVLVYSRTAQSRIKFARLMAEQTGLTVEAVDRAREIVRRCGITISATTAMDPMIKLADVRPGSLHIHMGTGRMKRPMWWNVPSRPTRSCATIPSWSSTAMRRPWPTPTTMGSSPVTTSMGIWDTSCSGRSRDARATS